MPIRRSTNPWSWSVNPSEPTAFGENLHFKEHLGHELWRSDRSSSIAVPVRDPALPPAASPRSQRHLAAVGDTLCFAAAVGSAGSKELWKSQPAIPPPPGAWWGPSSQVFVKDCGKDPTLAIAANTLFLSAKPNDNTTTSGDALWRLDQPSLVVNVRWRQQVGGMQTEDLVAA